MTTEIAKTVGLLILSNTFMLFAWYGHLKNTPKEVSWVQLAGFIVISWGIAFFEYVFQVPANRIGSAAGLSVAQLKVMQEVITLSVFVPFAIFFMKETKTPALDYLCAGLCLVGAVYFIFRSR
jgi:uncharacterized protein (DUF486 family)